MITAQQARKLANDRERLKIANELRNVFEKIQQVANDGGYRADFYEEDNIVTLGLIRKYSTSIKSLGYIVNDGIEGDKTKYTSIKW
jgi:hypothetical protein